MSRLTHFALLSLLATCGGCRGDDDDNRVFPDFRRSDAQARDGGSSVDAPATDLTRPDGSTPTDTAVRPDGTTTVDAPPPVDAAPSPFAVVINEFLPNPAPPVDDDQGEWLELYNPSASETVDLAGWVLKDDDSDSHTIGTLTIGPQQYAVLAVNDDTQTNGGVTVDYVYPYNDFQLANSGDEIELFDAEGRTVDRVVYGSSDDPNGASLQLEDPALDNGDVDSNWCEAVVPWADGDKGTPGAANNCGAQPPDGGIDAAPADAASADAGADGS